MKKLQNKELEKVLGEFDASKYSSVIAHFNQFMFMKGNLRGIFIK